MATLGIESTGASTPASTAMSGAKAPSVMSSVPVGGGVRKASTGRRMSLAVVDVSGFSAPNFQPEFCIYRL